MSNILLTDVTFFFLALLVLEAEGLNERFGFLFDRLAAILTAQRFRGLGWSGPVNSIFQD
jgi:hypothetical protein